MGDAWANFKEEWLNRESLAIYGLAVVLLGLAFWAAAQFIPPPPPRTVRIATGSAAGTYKATAERYRDLLEREGFELEIIETKGSIDNLERLRKGEVEVAFVQGGTSKPEDEKVLRALGSVYREPLWIFYRGSDRVEYLKAFKSRTMAIGEPGSGTRAVALQLLAENGIAQDPELHKEIGGQEASRALLAGEVQAMVICTGPSSPVVRELLNAPGVHLMSFRRQHAYQRQYPFLSGVLLGEGMIDLKTNTPPRDTQLVAPTATLCVREDVHPAIVPLMLSAARSVHARRGMFADSDEFPTPRFVDLPLHLDAERFYRYGPSFLQRILPFWLAALIDRTKIMLLPLLTLLLPLGKIAPPVYRWRIRSKIYRWYRDLRVLDLKLLESDPGGDLLQIREQLTKLERELADITVPLSYMEEFYNLCLHVQLVREKLDRRLGSGTTGAEPGVAPSASAAEGPAA